MNTPEQQRAEYRRTREAAIKKLGGKCAKCGSEKMLDLHHVNGDGEEHRAKIGQGEIATWLKKNGYPKGIVELLCRACHRSGHSVFRPSICHPSRRFYALGFCKSCYNTRLEQRKRAA